MKCDCCGKDEKHEIMYRTLDTRVYCWYCSKGEALCCYNKPVLPTTWFRVSMSERALESLEERGHKREFEDSKLNPLTITRNRDPDKAVKVPPKYKARAAVVKAKAALNFGRKPKRMSSKMRK